MNIKIFFILDKTDKDTGCATCLLDRRHCEYVCAGKGYYRIASTDKCKTITHYGDHEGQV